MTVAGEKTIFEPLRTYLVFFFAVVGLAVLSQRGFGQETDGVERAEITPRIAFAAVSEPDAAAAIASVKGRLGDIAEIGTDVMGTEGCDGLLWNAATRPPGVDAVVFISDNETVRNISFCVLAPGLEAEETRRLDRSRDTLSPAQAAVVRGWVRCLAEMMAAPPAPVPIAPSSPSPTHVQLPAADAHRTTHTVQRWE